MTSCTGKVLSAIHVLPNISRSKGKIKFCYSREYDVRNTFLEKLYTKCGRETSPTPYPEYRN